MIKYNPLAKLLPKCMWNVADTKQNTPHMSFQSEPTAMILASKVIYRKWMMLEISCWLRTYICFNFALSTQKNKTCPFTLHEEKHRSFCIKDTKLQHATLTWRTKLSTSLQHISLTLTMCSPVQKSGISINAAFIRSKITVILLNTITIQI